MDLAPFAADVGSDGPVTIAGASTHGGAVPGVRVVRAPDGIATIEPEEMTVRCGAGTTVVELDAALAAYRQCVALPVGGTVGGTLARGQSGIRRLGYGPVRDALLQADVVVADGRVVKAGGPTVKNVSGFDLCRLLVGSNGTLAFIGSVILRTRPLPAVSQWYAGSADPFRLRVTLYAPTSILWDGTTTWVLLEGHRDDVGDQARVACLREVSGPPEIPSGGRRSMPSAQLRTLGTSPAPFIAEVGVGVVHTVDPAPPPETMSAGVAALNARIKTTFDPGGRLNPGR